MATTKLAERDPLASLTSILDLFNGKTTTQTNSPTTTTSTETSNLTQAQIQAQIDNAMAPLNQASHSAGLSTYSDTNLALGRAQVAADTAARYAGTTKTTTTSGGTTTQNTGGALSGNLGSSLGKLALTQIGLPLAKKLNNKLGLTDTLNDTIDKGLDSVISSVGDLFSSSAGSDILSDSASNFISSAGGDIATAALEGSGTLLGDTVGSSGADLWDTVSGWFADGGTVRPGYVDRNVDRSYLDSNMLPNANISANGIIDPDTVASNAAMDLISSISTTPDRSGNGGTKASAGYRGEQGYQGPGTYKDASRPGLADAGLANLGISALSSLGPLGALAAAGVSRFTDTPSLSALAMNDLKTFAETTYAQNTVGGGNSNAATAAAGGFDRNNTAGNSSESQTGTGNSAGEGGNGGSATAANGGTMKGPGTGTSDSIPARLSNGETVITAQTSAKVKQILGDDFFHNLEQMFNAPAAAAQVAQGRN